MTSGNEDANDELDLDFLKGDDGGDFDAEAFLNVKKENLEQADIFSGANASLMEKYIQVLSYEQRATKQNAAVTAGPQGLPPPASGGAFNHPARR